MAKVLIIDDSPADREMVRRALEREPLRSVGTVSVHEACSASEARRVIDSTDPDCIILDYRLSDANGIDFLNSLRADVGKPLPPVIFVTGQGSEKVAAETVRQRLNDYLIKNDLKAGDLRRSVDGAIERHRIHRQLQRYHDALERSNSELSNFASRVAHDLRSPINVIKGYSELLLRHDELSDEERDAYLQSIYDGTCRVDRMIHALYDFSTVGHGELDAEFIPLAEIWDDVRSMLAKDILKAGAAIHFSTGPPAVFGSRGLLLLLFQNLIGNALKYAGDAKPRINVSAESAGETVAVSIADNGIGVPEDQRDQVFEMFYRVDTEGETEGSGIGLATCRKIVEKHGGKIWCDGNPDGGSVFRITLQAPKTV